MKKLYLFLLILSLPFVLKSQTSEYIISPDVTAKRITMYTIDYKLFQVKEKKLELPRYDTNYVETKKYLELKEKLNKLKKDSVELVENYQIELAKYNEILSINTHIDSFLNSNDRYKIKKNYLYNAQILANKYKLEYLIYADKNINQGNLTDYVNLRFDQESLIDHLVHVKNEIIRQTRKPYNPNDYNSYFSDLQSIRRTISSTKKLEMKLVQNGTIQRQGYLLDSPINDLKKVVGVFQILGDYCVMGYDYGGYLKNQIVKLDEIEKNELKQYTDSRLSLIKEINSGKLFYGTKEFIENCGTDVKLMTVINKLRTLGYNVTEERKGVFINTTKATILLTSDIYANINNGNIKYIDEVVNSVYEFKRLINQAVPLTEKLEKHYSAYHYGTLTTERFSLWKKDVSKAQELLDKLNNLKGEETDYQIDVSTLEKYNDFWQVVKGSKAVLGM